MEVALGRVEADLLFQHASVLNVYTGEVLTDQYVATKGSRIAYVGPPTPILTGPSTVVVEVDNKVIIPGFVDSHLHIDELQHLPEFLRLAMPRGTTCLALEVSAIANALGYRGAREYMESFVDQPIKVYSLVPAISLLCSDDGEGNYVVSVEEMEEMLEREDVIGIGEVYWRNVIEGDARILRLIHRALELGKVVEGHSAGAKNNKLAAYVASGISSCHEPITEQEILDRLRLGMHVMIREGSVRRELDNVAGFANQKIDFRRLMLTSDGLWPDYVVKHGHLDYVVQKAIDLGFDPVEAIRMATLNAAEYLGLDAHIGGITPGRYADLCVIPTLRTIRPELVVSNGRVVAENGRLVVEPRRHEFSAYLLDWLHLPKELTPEDFNVYSPVDSGPVKVRAIENLGDILTGESIVELDADSGIIPCDVERDILKVAVIDTVRRPGRCATAFIKGYGLKAGAFATSLTFDVASIAVVGASEMDMAAAVNRIRELSGGAVICRDGKVLAELPLPIAGAIPDLPAEEVADRIEALQQAAWHLGSALGNPFVTLQTITFGAVPYLRLRSGGLVDVRRNAIVDTVLATEQ